MEISKRRDLVLFLKEFCTFSQTLQPQSRETFFKTLASLGILPALEITLGVDDLATKSASIDILSYIVEFSPSMVRDYMLQQVNSAEDENLLLNIIIEQMMCDSDPELGGAVQLSGILRLLIDPENMLASINKSEKADFLNFFYKHSMHVLVNPLLSNTTNDRPTKEDYPTVQLLGLILELLSFCVEHHTYHIKNYILNRDLLRRILVLMRSRHTFLVLSALRFLRKIISLKGKVNVWTCIFEPFKTNWIFMNNLLQMNSTIATSWKATCFRRSWMPSCATMADTICLIQPFLNSLSLLGRKTSNLCAFTLSTPLARHWIRSSTSRPSNVLGYDMINSKIE